MQILIPAALVLLSFNVAWPKTQVSGTSSQTQPDRLISSSTHDVLKGISGLYVVVEDLDDEAKAKGLNKEALTRRAESVLRRNGIQVLTRSKFIRAVGGTFL